MKKYKMTKKEQYILNKIQVKNTFNNTIFPNTNTTETVYPIAIKLSSEDCDDTLELYDITTIKVIFDIISIAKRNVTFIEVIMICLEEIEYDKYTYPENIAITFNDGYIEFDYYICKSS